MPRPRGGRISRRRRDRCRVMAADPLDEWRETIATDRGRTQLLPKGQVRNAINKKLREMETILAAIAALPEGGEPFRCRVEKVARLMKETPSNEKTEWKRILEEFAACVKIARRMN